MNGDQNEGLDSDSLRSTLIESLGIEVLESGRERMVARMPVDRRTRQPAGLLHGGASTALAETLASIGTHLYTDPEKQIAVGLEINANHIRPVRDGYVTAVAVPLHAGRSTCVWDIRIRDDEDRLVCVSRCTVAIVPKR